MDFGYRLPRTGYRKSGREVGRLSLSAKPAWMEKDQTSLRQPEAGSRLRRFASNIMVPVGSRTGRSLPVSSGARRGKSELRRAVCRIKSGTSDSSLLDGKCHRKHTALAA